nr:sigma-70 family RNA polymerase sigma factor [uncultured Arsenicibacter sp.]
MHLKPPKNMYATLTDELLIQSFLETRKHHFFDELYRRYFARVMRMCQPIAATTFEAEDMAQEVFLKVLARLDTFGGRAQFSTWLRVITRNYCSDQLRNACKEERRFNEYASFLLKEEGVSGYDDYTQQEEQVKYLDRALVYLTPQEQKLLHARYQLQLPVEQIALQEKCKLSTIKMRLSRARVRLRNAYMQAAHRDLVSDSRSRKRYVLIDYKQLNNRSAFMVN